MKSLSRRERQILDVIYAAGRATAAEVQERLPDAPTYTTIRGLLRILEEKGHLRHEEEGGRYVYIPTVPRHHAARSAIRHVVKTFFDDSPSRAMAALLGGQREVSDDEIARLEELIARARRKEKA